MCNFQTNTTRLWVRPFDLIPSRSTHLPLQNRDLEPFRGMKPQYLHSLQPEWENSHGTYVLECNAPSKPGCHLVKKTFDNAGDERVGVERAREQLGLLKDVEKFLPHLRVTFSGHDGPAQMVGHEYVSDDYFLTSVPR